MRISDWSSDVCSSDLSVTYWNRGAEELYGWTKAAVAGRTATDLLQTQFPLSRAAAMETLMQTDRWEGVLVHARRDGPPATVASRWSLERNERGQPKDRTSVVSGKSVSILVNLGGGRFFK